MTSHSSPHATPSASAETVTEDLAGTGGENETSATRTPTRPERRSWPDPVLIEQFRRYRRTGERQVRNKLVDEHRWLASVAARKFANRGEPLDDLRQVALLGVLKAVERFDPERGSSFVTFALPTITGELRRHFRDATWAVRVSRRAQELHLAMGAVLEPLAHRLGRSPTPAEIADAMGVRVDDVLEAMEAGNAYRASSLSSRPGDDASPEETRVLATDDAGLVDADLRVTLRGLLEELPERERRIMYLRYFDELTQTEIAQQVGVSQVHVSRLLRSSLDDLRRRLAAAPRAGSASVSGAASVSGTADRGATTASNVRGSRVPNDDGAETPDRTG